ncbi:hypothetical protein ACFQGT_11235 [Natrialbaceae archaeon GCM10025810]|uniref:hypothetical protein n=1 Tax=Halovalidus salilacus TaxID=3075124 RepID=UPI0036200B9D
MTVGDEHGSDRTVATERVVHRVRAKRTDARRLAADRADGGGADGERILDDGDWGVTDPWRRS